MNKIAYLIAFAIIGRLTFYMLYFCGVDSEKWGNYFFIWFKLLLCFCFLTIRSFVANKEYRRSLLLLASFFSFTIIWEIIVLISPKMEYAQNLITVLFLLLIIVISCITYLPYIKLRFKKW